MRYMLLIYDREVGLGFDVRGRSRKDVPRVQSLHRGHPEERPLQGGRSPPADARRDDGARPRRQERRRRTGRSPRRGNSSAATTSSTRRTSTRPTSIAARIPGARMGSIEVRPIMEMARLSRPASMSLERIYREESGRILATLIRLVGDFDLAEEVMHDAFAAALEQWPGHGVPDNPRRLARLDGPAQGDRPASPRRALPREARGARPLGGAARGRGAVLRGRGRRRAGRSRTIACG